MNKKLFTIFVITVFLIASISFVSASDDMETQDIFVKVKWNDEKNIPNQVTVNLIHDGKVVDSAKLSESNSWNTTFKNQECSGTYSVKINDDSDYSVDIKGNAEEGFVITCKVIEESVLGATDDNVVEEPVLGAVDDNVVEEPKNDETSLAEDNNGTNSSENNNSNATDDSNNTSNNTDKKDNTKNTTKKTTTKNKKKTTKKTVVKKDKKPKPVEKNNNTTLKKAGLPIALVVVAMIAIFIPIVNFRKK